MADPFVAEVRMFPFNFAPKGWAFCNGQVLPISQNTALFSLLGTTYGGDGKSTFALPDLQGRASMHPGQGPGLTLRDLGESAGSDSVSLISSEIPAHGHTLQAFPSAEVANPTNTRGWGNAPMYQAPGMSFGAMAPETIAPAGGSAPHNNMQPYLTLSFCIALQGVFPQRPL